MKEISDLGTANFFSSEYTKKQIICGFTKTSRTD
jgi:hypothetical protein